MRECINLYKYKKLKLIGGGWMRPAEAGNEGARTARRVSGWVGGESIRKTDKGSVQERLEEGSS